MPRQKIGPWEGFHGPCSLVFGGRRERWGSRANALKPTLRELPKMNAHIKSYLWFVGFLALTKIVIKPIATNLNVPLVKDILS